MKKFNRLQLRRFKKETLLKKKEEHRRFKKKILKKAIFNIAEASIGLELNTDESNYPQAEISYLDTYETNLYNSRAV